MGELEREKQVESRERERESFRDPEKMRVQSYRGLERGKKLSWAHATTDAKIGHNCEANKNAACHEYCQILP